MRVREEMSFFFICQTENLFVFVLTMLAAVMLAVLAMMPLPVLAAAVAMAFMFMMRAVNGGVIVEFAGEEIFDGLVGIARSTSVKRDAGIRQG